MTFVRLKCVQLNDPSPVRKLAGITQLSDSEELIFTHYSPIPKIRIQNMGGHQVIKCESFRLPKGVLVSVSSDGRTCEIGGVPTTPQARTEAYVIATNSLGSSLAVVPISVNAIVLRE
ncbi:MAG: hypothetical protein AB8B89_07970 [Gammaproteobacteria bacterium]